MHKEKSRVSENNNLTTKITAAQNGHDIIIERDFNAKAPFVFEMFSNPDYLTQWLFPKEADLKIEKFECHTGGSFLTWHKGASNMKFGFKGVFHEVKNPELIIQTSEFLGLSFKVIPTLEILNFESKGSHWTKFTKQIICINNEVRNAMLQNGMEQQFTSSFIRIDQLLLINQNI